MPKGVFKRKGSTFWWIRYAGIDGKTVFESSKSTKQKVAIDLYHQRKAEIQEGKEPEPRKKIKSHSFKELCNEYKKWAERQRCYPSKVYLIEKLEEHFKTYPLRRFTSMILEQYQSDLMREYKPATVNRLLATIKHMFTKAVDWEMVEEGILKKIRKVKFLEENNRRLRYLSGDEVNALVKESAVHLKPIVLVAVNTGMRKSEILSLKWENVDLKHGFILLDRTKNGERREIPINETVRQALLERHRGTDKKPRRLDVPYVFYEYQTGKPYTDVKTAFRSACRRAKIEDFHFHDLRHCFASHLVMAGIDLTTVKELLGHKTLSMTLRYAHLAPSHKVNAVNVLDGVLRQKDNQNVEEVIGK